ncbi:MAG: hypothetical protein ACI80M_000449, partial [Gammaproteobacteria bacterium]
MCGGQPACDIDMKLDQLTPGQKATITNIDED